MGTGRSEHTPEQGRPLRHQRVRYVMVNVPVSVALVIGIVEQF